MNKEEAYYKGFIDGLRCFAWWKDGEQYIGTRKTRLKDAEGVIILKKDGKLRRYKYETARNDKT